MYFERIDLFLQVQNHMQPIWEQNQGCGKKNKKEGENRDKSERFKITKCKIKRKTIRKELNKAVKESRGVERFK